MAAIYTQNRDLKLEALLAEYNALRKEIEGLMKNENMYINFSVTLMVAAVALTKVIYSNNFNLLLFVGLLLLPIPIFIFAYLFMRQHEEVFGVASYIKSCIRPQIRDLCSGDDKIWTWKEYKGDFIKRIKIPHTRSFQIKIALFAFLIFMSVGSAVLYAILCNAELPFKTDANLNFLVFILLSFNTILFIKLWVDMYKVPRRLIKAFEDT